MYYTKNEVIRFVAENDVKFIRLAFVDPFGVPKNISIQPGELSRAFDGGIAFDASAIQGFGESDNAALSLWPDPSTLSVLPWRPSHGRVVRFYCDIKYRDGRPYELDTRRILRRAVADCLEAGVSATIGCSCQFYLFKTDENGDPTGVPYDNAGYFDMAPDDKGENVRREICLTLEDMDIKPESSHHEAGPGQNEIVFKYGDALTCADNVVTFRSVVRTIAAKNGLYADFSPKPIADECGNGFYVCIAPYRTGTAAAGSDCTEGFIGGILDHISEMTAFLNPSERSYERLGSGRAPKYISWSYRSRSQLIRVPENIAGGSGVSKSDRLEVRSPDSLSNPYLVYALLLYAGLDGMRRGVKPPQPFGGDIAFADKKALEALGTLPSGFEEALAAASRSAFITDRLGVRLTDIYRMNAGKRK